MRRNGCFRVWPWMFFGVYMIVVLSCRGMWDEWVCCGGPEQAGRVFGFWVRQAVRDETRLIECRRRQRTFICNQNRIFVAAALDFLLTWSRPAGVAGAGSGAIDSLSAKARQSPSTRFVHFFFFFFSVSRLTLKSV